MHKLSLADGRYEIIDVLGKGGMAAVFLAKDTRLEKLRAVKILSIELGLRGNILDRFKAEALTMAQLDHQNTVHIYDFGTEGSSSYIVMEMVDGGSVHDLITKRYDETGKGLPLSEAGYIFKSALQGLNAAHDKGIIHRDIKPDNMLIAAGNIVKITDFGIASLQSLESRMTRTGAVMGTLNYMPPEQRIDSSKVSIHSDHYSLVASFYEMLTNRSPINLYDADHHTNLFQGLDPLVCEFIKKGTMSAPADRYRDAQELSDALDQVLDALIKQEPEPQIYKIPQPKESSSAPNTSILIDTWTNITGIDFDEEDLLETAIPDNQSPDMDDFPKEHTSETLFFHDESPFKTEEKEAPIEEDESQTNETLIFDDEHNNVTKVPKNTSPPPDTSRTNDTSEGKGPSTEQINDAKNIELNNTEIKKDSNGQSLWIAILSVAAIIALFVFYLKGSDTTVIEDQPPPKTDVSQIKVEDTPPPKDIAKDIAKDIEKEQIKDKQTDPKTKKAAKKNSGSAKSSSTVTTSKSTSDFGSLVITATPNPKKIYVDGKEIRLKMRKAEISSISSGQHKIQIEPFRGDPHSINIEIKADQKNNYCWNFIKNSICQ